MLVYQLQNAWRSLGRTPLLSALLVAGIGLGIGVATTFVTINYLFASDPIPEASDRLFYVRLDSWNPGAPYDEENPERPPDQVTYRDAVAVHGSGIPTHEAVMYKAALTVHPESEADRPYREVVRMTHGDFFRMFDPPFRFGGGWGDAADAVPEPMVVLDAATNRRLFGGADSVGETVRIGDRLFIVVGVLDEWRPVVKFYDVHNGPFDAPEGIYMPFGHIRTLEARTAGNTNGWTYDDPVDYLDHLDTTEDVFLQYWAELDGPRQVDAFQGFLDAYAREQKELGRFGRPINNWLQPLPEWLAEEEVVPDQTVGLLVISLLFLVVCSVNLIGILLAKFLGRAPEVGVRRALGASRRQVFAQHLVECELIGVLGGALGVILSLAGLEAVERLFDGEIALHLDLAMVAAGIALSLVAGLVAGLYPSWRICRVAPARYLKVQ